MPLHQARQKVMEYFVSINDGIDPFKQQEQEVFTITDLCRQYIEKHAKVKKRTWKEDRRKIDFHILSRFGNMAAIDLKRRHVRELLEEIGVDHPYESNRLKSLISKIFNFGIQQDLLPEDHISSVKHSIRLEESRDRWIKKMKCLI